MKFQATLQLGGKTATGIQVPPEVVESLGQSKRQAVRVTINDYTYRSTVAVMGGVFMLPVSAEVRQHAGVAAGDELEIDLELDTEPREVAVPPALAQALEQDPVARQTFDRLSYSHKRQHILAIEAAKTPETRQRRVEKTLSMLNESKA